MEIVVKTGSNPYRVVETANGPQYHALPALPAWRRDGYKFRTRQRFTATVRLTDTPPERSMVEVEDIETGNRYWINPTTLAKLNAHKRFDERGTVTATWEPRQTKNSYHIVNVA